VYKTPFLTTGASKGGEAAIIHRRFFPDDVSGTVAYVAPNYHGTTDPRTGPFLATRGTPECRRHLLRAQRTMLARRAEIERALLATDHASYARLGFDEAFEDSVEGLPFNVWQHYDSAVCAEIPADMASAAVWARFLERYNPPKQDADAELTRLAPYFYQCAFQLGYVGSVAPDIQDLLRHHGGPFANVMPPGVNVPAYNASAMIDVAAWVGERAQRLLLIYGENDPITAAMFNVGRAAESARFIAPNSNHDVAIANLTARDRKEALDLVHSWLGSPRQ
jgi:hypothetical protein